MKRPIHEIVILILTIAFCVSLGMIILALCYRVVIDGNDDVSKNIATSLMTLGVALVFGLAGAVGINKIGPSPATQPVGIPLPAAVTTPPAAADTPAPSGGTTP